VKSIPPFVLGHVLCELLCVDDRGLHGLSSAAVEDSESVWDSGGGKFPHPPDYSYVQTDRAALRRAA
jgi:hypothetical protein